MILRSESGNGSGRVKEEEMDFFYFKKNLVIDGRLISIIVVWTNHTLVKVGFREFIELTIRNRLRASEFEQPQWWWNRECGPWKRSQSSWQPRRGRLRRATAPGIRVSPSSLQASPCGTRPADERTRNKSDLFRWSSATASGRRTWTSTRTWGWMKSPPVS